jgi:hypothetical protein
MIKRELRHTRIWFRSLIENGVDLDPDPPDPANLSYRETVQIRSGFAINLPN